MNLFSWLISNPALFLMRLFLGVVFIFTGLEKIGDPARFADSIANYHLLPMSLVNAFALILPWVEVLAGLALINNVACKSGALLILLMNIVFIIAIGSAMARGFDIECGCSTLAAGKVGWGLIARDFGFMLMSYLILRYHREPQTTEVEKSSPVQIPGV